MDIDPSSNAIFDDMEKTDFSVGPGGASWLVFGEPTEAALVPSFRPWHTGCLLPKRATAFQRPSSALPGGKGDQAASSALGGVGEGDGGHAERDKLSVESASAQPVGGLPCGGGGRVSLAKIQSPFTALPFPSLPPSRCSLLPCTVSPKPALPRRNWTLRRTGGLMGRWPPSTTSLGTSSTAHISPFPR